MKIKRAIVSVSDKTGLTPFVKELRRFKVELFSTGGTLALLRKNKVPVHSITELTGFPEILDGRLKTLHPKVHGGLLFLRSNKTQLREAKRHGILPIDLVVVNLYPFPETVRKPGVSLKEAIEQIDIGGPAMLRSAAKNFGSVAVLSDPKDYPHAIEELRKGKGAFSIEFRRFLAVKAFGHTAAYDREIVRYLDVGARSPRPEKGGATPPLPDILDDVYQRSEELRYGENPHQRAALYHRTDDRSRFSFEQLQGKMLSYNNLLDFEAAADILREFKEPAACVVKHNNPCGISADPKIGRALQGAIEGDPVSAFGGIVGLNRTCDDQLARTVFEKLPFFEVLLAPHYTDEALSILKSRKNLRIVRVQGLDEIKPYEIRFAKSGLLIQDLDRPIWEREARLRKNLRWVTEEALKPDEAGRLLFAWKCVKVVRSNAIVLTQGKQTVGIGGGQMSRVDSVKLACMKAGERAQGAILASDGFFPMTDNIEIAHQYGIRAIIQPGGSIRDSEVIQACNKFGIAMAFTGERHFKH